MKSNVNRQDSQKEKIDKLNQLAWDVRVSDSPRSLLLSQESVELSRKIKYTKGLAHGLRSFGFCNVRQSKNEEVLTYLNESFSLFTSLNDLEGLSLVYEYQGIIQRNWGNFGASRFRGKRINQLLPNRRRKAGTNWEKLRIYHCIEHKNDL